MEEELVRILPFNLQPMIQWTLNLEEQETQLADPDEASATTATAKIVDDHQDHFTINLEICYRFIYKWIYRCENGEEIKVKEWECNMIEDSFCLDLQSLGTLSERLSKLRQVCGDYLNKIGLSISSYATELLMEMKKNQNNNNNMEAMKTIVSVDIEKLKVYLYNEALEVDRVLRDSMEDARLRGYGTVPASTSSIQALEKVTRTDGEDHHRYSDTKDCLICLEELEHQVTRMPCNHVFHGDCITRWLQTSHYCPICRFEMPI